MDRDPENEQSKLERVNDAVSEASLEDKVWLFWKHYSRHVVLGGVLIVFGYIGYFGLNLYKERQLDKLQEAYRDAMEDERELVFAENNAKEPLAGLVFLEAGDKALKEGEPTGAIEHYEHALKSLRNTALGSRVRLSMGMAKIEDGRENEGHRDLEALAKDPNAMEVAQAGAAYQLAMMELEKGNFTQAKQFLEIAINTPNAGIWGEKGLILKNTTPELAD